MYRTFKAASLAFVVSITMNLTAPPAHADFALALQAYQTGDYATATAIWQPMAEQGDPAAQRNLALILTDPRAGKTNPRAAAEWLRKAAASRFPRAHYDLAYMHLQGHGVPPDAAVAAQHMQQAAHLGMREAQHDLAVLFEQGTGVEQNTDMAIIWYRRAVQSGYAQAVPKLARLMATRKSRTVQNGGDFAPLDPPAADQAGQELTRQNATAPAGAAPGVKTTSDIKSGTAPAQGKTAPADAGAGSSVQDSRQPQVRQPANAPTDGRNSDIFQNLVKFFRPN